MPSTSGESNFSAIEGISSGVTYHALAPRWMITSALLHRLSKWRANRNARPFRAARRTNLIALNFEVNLLEFCLPKSSPNQSFDPGAIKVTILSNAWKALVREPASESVELIITRLKGPPCRLRARLPHRSKHKMETLANAARPSTDPALLPSRWCPRQAPQAGSLSGNGRRRS